MIIDDKTGLVLEGGGMRGVFTCGVLDYLLDRHIHFTYCVGVSAGACNGLSYVSRQRGRAKKTNVDMLDKYHYIGLRFLWQQHSILDQKTLYDRMTNELLPFDFEAYFQSGQVFEIVTTNCRTGAACYLSETGDPQRLVQLARASSSLPYVCPITDVDGEPMLDGGIVDSIPVERAIATGHGFNVVVLTRNRGYRDTAHDHRQPTFVYKNYPRLRARLSRRHAYYNRELELVDRLESEGRILVIRPERPLRVDRLTDDVSLLTDLYNEGYDCACRALQSVDIRL